MQLFIHKTAIKQAKLFHLHILVFIMLKKTVYAECRRPNFIFTPAFPEFHVSAKRKNIDVNFKNCVDIFINSLDIFKNRDGIF